MCPRESPVCRLACFFIQHMAPHQIIQLKKYVSSPSSVSRVLWKWYASEVDNDVCWKNSFETSCTLWYEEYYKKLTSSCICVSDLLSCVFKKEEKKNEETHF